MTSQTDSYTARFIELASEINTEMPRYWVQKVQVVLNDAAKAVKGSHILVLGVAYHDPHVPAFQHDGMEMVGVTDVDAALAAANCVVIVTDHDAYNWTSVRRAARLLVDTRHVA